MSIKFTFIPHGESILIESKNFNLLIDGGNSDPLFVLEGIRKEIPRIDGIAVTHIDQDHILGIINLLKNSRYEGILEKLKFIAFNEPTESNLFRAISSSKKTSMKQGTNLKEIIKNHEITHRNEIYVENEDSYSFLKDEIVDFSVDILSPDHKSLEKLFNTWEKDKDYRSKATSSAIPKTATVDELSDGHWVDTSISNGSSLSFLISHKGHNFLLLGDAYIDQVVTSLKSKYNLSEGNPMEVEFVKLSHHGSKRNISDEFLKIIKTNNYIICKPSENYKKLPDAETIAKIVKYGKRLTTDGIIFFYTGNFKENINFSKEDKEKFNFSFAHCDQKEFTFGE